MNNCTIEKIKHPDKSLCTLCKKRKCVSTYNGKRRVRKDHDLCDECYRNMLNSFLCGK